MLTILISYQDVQQKLDPAELPNLQRVVPPQTLTNAPRVGPQETPGHAHGEKKDQMSSKCSTVDMIALLTVCRHKEIWLLVRNIGKIDETCGSQWSQN